jgi:hypothetical protein
VQRDGDVGLSSRGVYKLVTLVAREAMLLLGELPLSLLLLLLLDRRAAVGQLVLLLGPENKQPRQSIQPLKQKIIIR